MRTATQIAHASVGSPCGDGCHELGAERVCAVCAGPCARGKSVDDFGSAATTDHNSWRAPHSDVVCEGCVYVRQRIADVPGRQPKPCDRCAGAGVEPEGAAQSRMKHKQRQAGQPCAKCDGTGKKESAGRWSNFSHMYDGTTLDNATKGEKPKILAFLRRMSEPGQTRTWFAAISDTGQKHVLQFAPVNYRTGAGRIRFEETELRTPTHGAREWALIDETAQLLTEGATKEEIERGAYGAFAYQRCRARIEAYERSWANIRATPWFVLALWLAQRDEEAVAERTEQERGQRGKAKRKTGR